MQLDVISYTLAVLIYQPLLENPGSFDVRSVLFKLCNRGRGSDQDLFHRPIFPRSVRPHCRTASTCAPKANSASCSPGWN